MPRPIQYGTEHRRRLIDAATRIIAEGGPGRLSLRGLAAEVGISTTAVYGLAGSLEELVSAVGLEAIESFTRAQEAACGQHDSVEELVALGMAYRSWAIANPLLYEVMFGGRVDLAEDGRMALGPLERAVGRLHAEGRLIGQNPEAAVMCIWAGVHGAVSLELTAPGGEWARVYPEQLKSLVRGWVD